MSIQRLGIILLPIVTAVTIYFVYPLDIWHSSDRKEKTIVAVLQTSDTREDYWQSVGAGAKAAAKELNARLEIVGPLTESDTDTHLRLIETAIQDKPQAILLAPREDARYVPLLKKIRQAGIRLILLDAAITGEKYDGFLADNHIDDGRLAAETLVTETGGIPSAAVIGDLNKTTVSAERELGVREALSPYANGIFGTYQAEDSEDRAYRIVKALLLEQSRMNAIIALNESAVLGAAKALKEQARAGEIKLIGFDSSIYKVKLMEEGILHAIVVQKPFNLGYLGVKSAAQLIEGKKTNPNINVSSIVINKEKMYNPENQKLLFPMVGN